jgi:hypothetical protein
MSFQIHLSCTRLSGAGMDQRAQLMGRGLAGLQEIGEFACALVYRHPQAQLARSELFVGFSDDRRLVVLRFVVAVFVLVIIIVRITRRHQVGHVCWPSGSALGNVCGHISSWVSITGIMVALPCPRRVLLLDD